MVTLVPSPRPVGYHCTYPLTLESSDALSGQHRGIPHLAKNERDVGHPASVREPDATPRRD